MKYLYFSFLLLILSFASNAQDVQTNGAICGDPRVRCVTSGKFGDADLPFKIAGELKWMGEYRSKSFYAVIVQSRKAIEGSGPAANDCGGQFTANERRRLQAVFPANRVFSSAFGCYDFEHSYTNVNVAYNFLAVYGGETEAQAKQVLNKVKGSGKYPGANIRRMQAVFCNACH
jgi:hypothetical protein